jgi:DNA gyrase subunit B
MDRKGDCRVIDAFVRCVRVTKEDLRDQAKLVKGLANLQKQRYFERFAPELVETKFAIAADSEHGGFKIVAPAKGGGVRRTTTIDFELMNSPEYADLEALSVELAGVGEAPYVLEHGSEQVEFSRIEELGERVNEVGKKGLAIQRYKGLGEMNPEQLWETTMDPARRTLLQVRIEDAYEADGLFSTLMGDLVEPRRAFIETHALSVRNLDV